MHPNTNDAVSCNNCPICLKHVRTNSKRVLCSSCKKHVHLKCTKITPVEFNRDYVNVSYDFFCSCCLQTIFPFNHIDNEAEYNFIINNRDDVINFDRFNNFAMSHFESHFNNLVGSIDEDENCEEIYKPITSSYITESELNPFLNSSDYKLDESLAVLHINCRSLSKNFSSVTNLLDRTDNKLNVIAVTETWLTPNNEENYQISGFNFFSKCRQGKTGGGVGLYIDQNLSCKLNENLCLSNEHIECFFVDVLE